MTKADLAEAARGVRSIIASTLFITDPNFDIWCDIKTKVFYIMTPNKGLINADMVAQRRISGALESLEGDPNKRNYTKYIITRSSIVLFNEYAFIENIPL